MPSMRRAGTSAADLHIEYKRSGVFLHAYGTCHLCPRNLFISPSHRLKEDFDIDSSKLNIATSVRMPRLSVILLVVAICFSNATALSQSNQLHSPRCRYLPGDAYWPNTHEWQQLNTSISGRLIKTIPLGSACHGPTYDVEVCAALARTWDLPQTQCGCSILQHVLHCMSN